MSGAKGKSGRKSGYKHSDRTKAKIAEGVKNYYKKDNTKGVKNVRKNVIKLNKAVGREGINTENISNKQQHIDNKIDGERIRNNRETDRLVFVGGSEKMSKKEDKIMENSKAETHTCGKCGYNGLVEGTEKCPNCNAMLDWENSL